MKRDDDDDDASLPLALLAMALVGALAFAAVWWMTAR
jgi:hypothetical protein